MDFYRYHLGDQHDTVRYSKHRNKVVISFEVISGREQTSLQAEVWRDAMAIFTVVFFGIIAAINVFVAVRFAGKSDRNRTRETDRTEN